MWYSDLSNNGTGLNKRTERKKFEKINIQEEINVQAEKAFSLKKHKYIIY